MCHPTLDALKNMKFRLSRNLMKFDRVTRFREMNSTMKSFRHPRSRKFSVFNRNYRFTFFQKKLNFPRVLQKTKQDLSVRIGGEVHLGGEVCLGEVMLRLGGLESD